MEKFLVKATNEYTGETREMLVEDTSALWAAERASNQMAPFFAFSHHPYDDITIKVSVVHE